MSLSVNSKPYDDAKKNTFVEREADFANIDPPNPMKKTSIISEEPGGTTSLPCRPVPKGTCAD